MTHCTNPTTDIQFRCTQSAEAEVGMQKRAGVVVSSLCTWCFCVCPPPADLPTGSYIQEDLSRCSSLCEAGTDCCDLMASCKCGTHTGQYDCICEKGYFGKGLQHECTGGFRRLCVSPVVAVLQLCHTNLWFLPSAASSCLNPAHCLALLVCSTSQLFLKSAPFGLRSLLMG